MASQKAEAVLSKSNEVEGLWKFKKGDYDIFFFPQTDTEPAKIMVAMKVDDMKVPPTGSGGEEHEGLAEFNGDERQEEFVFFASKVEMKLLKPRSNARRKEFRIEFEVPGAVVVPREQLLQSSGRSEEK